MDDYKRDGSIALKKVNSTDTAVLTYIHINFCATIRVATLSKTYSHLFQLMKDLPECELSHASSYSKHPHMSFHICCICRAFHQCEFFHDTPALFSLGSLLRKTNKYAAAPPCGWSSAASTHIDCSNSFHIGDRQTSQVWRLQEDPRATCSSSGTAPPKSDSL